MLLSSKHVTWVAVMGLDLRRGLMIHNGSHTCSTRYLWIKKAFEATQAELPRPQYMNLRRRWWTFEPEWNPKDLDLWTLSQRRRSVGATKKWSVNLFWRSAPASIGANDIKATESVDKTNFDERWLRNLWSLKAPKQMPIQSTSFQTVVQTLKTSQWSTLHYS